MNIFLVMNGTLVTSSTTDDILVGVTRNTVIELARELGITVKERPIDRTDFTRLMKFSVAEPELRLFLLKALTTEK